MIASQFRVSFLPLECPSSLFDRDLVDRWRRGEEIRPLTPEVISPAARHYVSQSSRLLQPHSSFSVDEMEVAASNNRSHMQLPLPRGLGNIVGLGRSSHH